VSDLDHLDRSPPRGDDPPLRQANQKREIRNQKKARKLEISAFCFLLSAFWFPQAGGICATNGLPLMSQSRVLIVEDEETIRALLVDFLNSSSNLAVDSARDGVEALHQLATQRYDVILLDLMMPKMSGVDLLDSLSAMTSDPSLSTPATLPAVIVITAAPDDFLPREQLRNRFPTLVRDVLRKPVDIAVLASAIEACCRPEN
jgi:CheY-like chemotaxis protein